MYMFYLTSDQHQNDDYYRTPLRAIVCIDSRSQRWAMGVTSLGGDYLAPSSETDSEEALRGRYDTVPIS